MNLITAFAPKYSREKKVITGEPIEGVLIRMKAAAVAYRDDPQKLHSIADEILCQVLEQQGYGEIVEYWRKLSKW